MCSNVGRISIIRSDNVCAMSGTRWLLRVICILFFAAASCSMWSQAYLPGHRTLMDAHNCYPYLGKWPNRIERALSAGTPLAIEQDLSWYVDKKTGKGWTVVEHENPNGKEPTLNTYFFDHVRPVVEAALRKGNQGDWPIITLNLDFKTEDPQQLREIWNLLEHYKSWITTAPRTADENDVQPLTIRPILVLTGESDAQKVVFYDHVPVGQDLLVFGAAHTYTDNPMAAPQVLEPGPRTNYRRWWNNSWEVVEAGGPEKAGDWTTADEARLQSLVRYAHSKNLWIRFYTLDGESISDADKNGWFHDYDFGSLAQAKIRWGAAYRAGVDYIASDEYELLAKFLRAQRAERAGKP